MKHQPTAAEIEATLIAGRDDRKRDHLMRFFKTGKGQYGEGDMFLGLTVPQTRAVVREAAHMSVDLDETQRLLHSPWHEVRLCGLLLLVEEMKRCIPRKTTRAASSARLSARRKTVADCYLRNARQANNWDLVDLSCQYILGPYIRLQQKPDYDILRRLSESENLWEQRIAIVTTLDFVRNRIFEPSLEMADRLLSHPHNLIHKATGWVLREVGKRHQPTLTHYLETHYRQMSRTTLRYAIERMAEPDRQFWLRRP